MMDKCAAEVAANLERAEESLCAARELLQGGYFDFCASRAYYASFYAATAALLANGLEFRKHSGVITAVQRHFVHTGRLSQQLGKTLIWLFDLRSVGDYGVTAHVPRNDAIQAVERTEAFLAAMRAIVESL